MTNACSGAINICIEALCDAGQNVLLPSPGFGLYNCLCEARGTEVRHYRLMVSYDVLTKDACRERPQLLCLCGEEV